MTVKIEKLERVFMFNGAKLPDVNPELSVEQVRDIYVNTYPELATAAVEGPTPINGTIQYVFTRWPRASVRVRKQSCAWPLLELLRQRSGLHGKHADSAREIGVGDRRRERSFFQSEFTHASGVRKHTRFPGGLLAMGQFLAGKEDFPSKYLVKLQQRLSEFVNDNDHTYRNEVQPRD